MCRQRPAPALCCPRDPWSPECRPALHVNSLQHVPSCRRPGWTLGTSPQTEKEGWGKRHVPPGDGRMVEKAWCSPPFPPLQHYLGADATLLVLKGIWGKYRAYEIRMLLPKVSTS